MRSPWWWIFDKKFSFWPSFLLGNLRRSCSTKFSPPPNRKSLFFLKNQIFTLFFLCKNVTKNIYSLKQRKRLVLWDHLCADVCSDFSKTCHEVGGFLIKNSHFGQFWPNVPKNGHFCPKSQFYMIKYWFDRKKFDLSENMGLQFHILAIPILATSLKYPFQGYKN